MPTLEEEVLQKRRELIEQQLRGTGVSAGPVATPVPSPVTAPTFTPPPTSAVPAGRIPGVGGTPLAAASGFNTGLAMALGMPVDLTNTALSLAGLGVREPVGGSEQILRLFNRLGLLYSPEGFWQRMVHRVGQEVGATAPAFAAGLGVMARVNPNVAVEQASGFVRRAMQLTVQDLARMNPGQLAAVETALAAAAGTGAGISREMFPDNVTAEITGQLVGGFGPAGAGALVRLAKRAGSKAASVLPAFSREAIQEEVGRSLRESISGLPEFGAEEALRLRQEIPGFRPTTAQATGEPGLIAAERQAARSPRFAAELTTRRSASEQAVREAFDQIIPPGHGGIADVTRAIEQRFDRVAARLGKLVKPVAERVGRFVARAEVARPDEEIGAALRTTGRSAEARLRAEAGARFGAIDPEGRIQLQTRRVKETAKRVSREEFAPQEEFVGGRHVDVDDIPGLRAAIDDLDVPPGDLADVAAGVSALEPPANIPDIAARILALPDDVPFNTLQAGRSEVLAEMRREAVAAVPNRKKIARLSALANAFEETLSTVPAWQEARAFFRPRAEALRQGAVADMLRRGMRGEAIRVPDENVAGLFLRSSKDAKAFKRAFGPGAPFEDAAATDSLMNFARKDFLDAATDEAGKLVASRAQRWVAKHGGALSEFPDLRKELTDTIASGKRLEGLELRGRRVRDAVDHSAAKLFLDADPNRAVDRVLSSRNPAQEMLSLSRTVRGDEAATRGMRRAFWDHAVGETTVPSDTFRELVVVNPDKLRRFVAQNESVMRTLYTPSELRSVQKVQRAADLMARVPRVPVPRGEADTQLAWTMSMAISRAYALERGVVGPRYTITEFIARQVSRVVGSVRREHMRMVLQDALFDPEIAKTLAMMSRGAPVPTVMERMRSHLVAVGAVASRREAVAATQE